VQETLLLNTVAKTGLYLVQVIVGEQILKGKFLLTQ
jgi:hypothetical protein